MLQHADAINVQQRFRKFKEKVPPQVSTAKAMPTVLYELSGADPRIYGSAVCLGSAFDDHVLLFQKVKIFKALLLFSAGRRAAAVRAWLCVFLYERRGRSGPLQLKWFYWGQALGGHLNIVVWLFCAAELGACESFRMGRQLSGVVADQIWAFLKLFKEAQLDCSKWCKRPPWGSLLKLICKNK